MEQSEMKLEAKSLDEAVGQINTFKAYKPYQYGGQWFIAQVDPETVLAFRTLKAVVNNLVKAGVATDKIFKVGK